MLRYGEYYQSSRNTERELYFDLYRMTGFGKTSVKMDKIILLMTKFSEDW